MAHAKGGPRSRVCARKNPKSPPLHLQQRRRRRLLKKKIGKKRRKQNLRSSSKEKIQRQPRKKIKILELSEMARTFIEKFLGQPLPAEK
jgi:hypothetical protein